MNTALRTQVKPAPVKPPLTPAQGAMLQRKCAWSVGMSGECEECQEKQLTINRYSTGLPTPSGLLPSSAELARSTPFSDPGAAARSGADHHFGRLSLNAAAPVGTSGA